MNRTDCVSIVRPKERFPPGVTVSIRTVTGTTGWNYISYKSVQYTLSRSKCTVVGLQLLTFLNCVCVPTISEIKVIFQCIPTEPFLQTTVRWRFIPRFPCDRERSEVKRQRIDSLLSSINLPCNRRNLIDPSKKTFNKKKRKENNRGKNVMLVY